MSLIHTHSADRLTGLALLRSRIAAARVPGASWQRRGNARTMSSMARLVLEVKVRLLRTEDGGRKRGIMTGYRPSWDLGVVLLGERQTNDAPLTYDGTDVISPGEGRTV